MYINRYVINTAQHIYPINDNEVAIISSLGNSCIKGPGMAAAMMDILSCFTEPMCLDMAISTLSKKYNIDNLEKLLNRCIDKRLLVSETEAKASSKHSKEFLDNAFFYTSGGKTLDEVIDTLSSVKIGIIGKNKLVSNLLRILAECGVQSEVHTGITDSIAEIEIPNSELSIHSCKISFDLDGISNVINKCDYIVATDSYDNHFFFNGINTLCLQKNKRWIRIVTNGLNAEIGPFVDPGETCCYACLISRRRRHLTDGELVFYNMFSDEQLHKKAVANPIIFSILAPLVKMVAGVACSELLKFIMGMKCSLINNVISLNCLDYSTQKERVFRNYQCPVCSMEERGMYV